MGAECLNRTSCTIPANAAQFGADPCVGVVKRLLVILACHEDSQGSAALSSSWKWMDFGDGTDCVGGDLDTSISVNSTQAVRLLL